MVAFQRVICQFGLVDGCLFDSVIGVVREEHIQAMQTAIDSRSFEWQIHCILFHNPGVKHTGLYLSRVGEPTLLSNKKNLGVLKQLPNEYEFLNLTNTLASDIITFVCVGTDDDDSVDISLII